MSDRPVITKKRHGINALSFRQEITTDNHFRIAEGPSPHDIARELHHRLVEDINRKIDMEFARQLVKLGWTPPPGHPVLQEPAPQNCTTSKTDTDENR